MKKQTIGLLFGGKSAEHEVSILSAQNIYEALHDSHHTIRLLYVSPQGQWLRVSEELMREKPRHIMHVMNSKQEGVRKDPFTFYNSSELAGIDIMFPILHGPYGEDGTVQAFLKMIGIPFVGSSVLGSAIGMDKDVMKRLLRDAGLPIVPFLVCHAHKRDSISYQKIVKELSSPLFIKPANLGSSIGVHKVSDEISFNKALDDAFSYDNKILIEKAINAREIECAVLGNNNPQISLPGEINPHHDFYSYDAKYVDAYGASFQIPADLSNEQLAKIQALARDTFTALGSSGLARVDFFLEKDSGTCFVNEINTLPGFTSISMYPSLWQQNGMSYAELVEQLLVLGIERFEDEKKLKITKD